jgi:lysyl-tRNA synthetase class 2
MGVRQGEQPYFLQTSPEFAMKRLLAAGSGPIYQICKAFRNDEQGSFHNPEFTMVEWYRPGFALGELIGEVSDLVQFLAVEFSVEGWGSPQQASYQQVFEDQLGINPHLATIPELAEIAGGRLEFSEASLGRDGWLNLLMSQVVEPALGPGPVFVYDFPASQAALAKVEVVDGGCSVAKRVELYINGIELANGYVELTDAEEQRRRFEADNRKRVELGLAELPIPEFLLQALASGMPEAAGVAMGLDRLLMVLMHKKSIDEVMAFPISRA